MLKAILRASAMVVAASLALPASPTIPNQPETSEAYEQASNFAAQRNFPITIVSQVRVEKDNRAEKLASFLESQGSPLASSANQIVEIADNYGLDWRLLPAIAGVESSFGKVLPKGSYNPYGWNNGKFYFESWEAATNYVAKEITSRWGGSSHLTPWRIGPGYAASPTWAARVNFYMRLITQHQST